MMRSSALLVAESVTVGAAFVEVHVETADAGTAAFESKGDAVFAPETPYAVPEAAVGVPLRFIVIVSEGTGEVATPHHSVSVVSWVPLQATRDSLAEFCQVIAEPESEIEVTVIDELAAFVTTHTIITSGESVAVNEATVKEEPLAQVPVNPPLASSDGPIVKDWLVEVAAVPEVVARFSHLPEQDPSEVLPR
jgi:hypothetical protein